MGDVDGRQTRPADDVGRPDRGAERPAVDGWREAWEDFWSSAETRRDVGAECSIAPPFCASASVAKKAFIAGWVYATVAWQVSERLRRGEAPHGAAAKDA